MARELSHEAPVLIAEQPTRGLDVGATEYIHEQLVAERDKGRAVLLVSAELSEILALSDRVLVMFEGRILADLPQDEADEETVGLLDGGADGGGGMNGRPRRARCRAACGRRRSRSPSCSPRWPAAALVLVSGHNPLSAYAEIVAGSLSPGSLPDTLNWATPLVGMTLVAAIPLRGGMVNLGGDGQLVIGGLIGALVPLFLPGPGALVAVAALAAAAVGARPLRVARRLGRDPPRHPDADLEPAAQLPGGRRDLLSRALSASRRDDRPAADAHDPAGGAALSR